jgi:hypothetical protein
MEFLKKHYEKILLSLVIVGLAVAAAWLPVAIRNAKEDLQKSIVNLPTPNEYKPVDLTTNEMALLRLQNPPKVELSGAHNLFNPVMWKVEPDGSFRKIVRQGIEALTVTDIRPLFMEVTFDRVTASGYFIGVESQSRTTRVYAKLNEQKELFKIKEVKGAPEDPTELVLEMADTQEAVSISKERPYKRIEGYIADLRYPPDSQNLPNKRVNDVIPIAGEYYKIIAITENDVRVSAISTDKRTTITWKGAP